MQRAHLPKTAGETSALPYRASRSVRSISRTSLTSTFTRALLFCTGLAIFTTAPGYKYTLLSLLPEGF
jgi:hypothetical protein